MANYSINFFISLLTCSLLLEKIYAADFVLDTMKKDGYVGEAHNVTTEDGYILTLHRINGGDNSTPILITHGLLFSSASWVMLGSNRSLAYLLAEQGYDVWLGNARGNNYGVSHINMTSNDSQFWQFTFHEMAIYDLPATINYICELRKRNIFYIGFSQGTQIAYIMASRRPEYAKKINLMISLAPIAYLNNLKGGLRFIHHIFKEYIPADRFLYPYQWFRFVERIFCTYFTIQSYLCQIIIFTIMGFNFEQFDNSIWEALFQGISAGTSFKNMIHYAQHVDKRRFNEYDYGEEKNMQIYNQTYPPIYDLSKVNVPTAFFCSKTDWLANYADAIKIYEMLPQKKGFFTIDYDKFTHIDFVWARDAKELLYDRIIFFLNSHRNS